jgi:hypothetical protein
VAAAAGDDGAFEYLSRWMNADERALAESSASANMLSLPVPDVCEWMEEEREREWENERKPPFS